MTKKNGRVELLRFIFALIILFFHIHKRFADGGVIELGNTGLNFFARGYIGVEFFFLVSGYLLAASAYAKRKKSTELIGTETALMMRRKFFYIFPYHLFATILAIITNAHFLRHTAADRSQYAVDSWASLFLLQVFGFDSTWANKLTWYLDVWFMVTFILYPILRKHYDVFVKIICPLLALFVLGYMAHEYESITGIEDGWTGIFYKCFLRGLSEMCLGCCTYSLTRQFNKYRFTEFGKKLLGVLEIIGYILVLLFSCSTVDVKYCFPVFFVMWLALILTFSNVNPCHEVFDKPVFGWLGKASLLIYLNQFYAIRLVQELFEDTSFVTKVILCSAITFAGAFACSRVVDFLRKKKPISKLILVSKGD